MKTLFFVILSVIGMSVFAANEDGLLSNTDAIGNENENSFSLTPDFGLMLGGSFMQFQGSGSLFSQTISPTMSWQISPDFRISAGAFISNYNPGTTSSFPEISMNSEIQEYGMFQNNLTSSMFFVAGAYDISSRLTITGAGWYDQNKTSMLFNNNLMHNNDIKGMMLGLDYKFSENFRFGAEINISSGYNPFMPINHGFHNQSGFNRFNTW